MAYPKEHNAIIKDPPPDLPSAVPTSDYVVGTLEYGIITQTINTSLFNLSDYYDDYDYDYDASISNLPLAEVVPVGIVYGLTLLLGVVGNALVIFSIARFRRMQSVTNIFLTSLSTADLLLVVLCVPIKVRSNGIMAKTRFSLYWWYIHQSPVDSQQKWPVLSVFDCLVVVGTGIWY